MAIGSTPDEVAKEFVPWAVERGCIVVDESGYWRMNPDVPLVIPEVNPDAALNHKGIIASPNCSTTQLVVAIKPLHDAARVKRVVVSTYQATSGAGLGRLPRSGKWHQGETQRARAQERNVRSRHRLQPDSADRLGRSTRATPRKK